MLRKGNNIIKKFFIFAVLIFFCLTSLQIGAEKITTNEERTLNIEKGEITLTKENIKKIAQINSCKKIISSSSLKGGTDLEVLTSDYYLGHTAVVSNGEGNAVFFIEYQNENDPSIREIIASPSYDNGLTWDFELTQGFPMDAGVNKLPVLDFRSGLTAYGSWVMDEPNGITPMARLEDISDPEAGEYGWVYWSPNWTDNFEEIGPFYSTDVACYDGPLNEEPDVFWGIALWTGKLDDPKYDSFDNGIFLIWFSGDYIWISWFRDLEGAYNIVTDIDQSNGMIYFASEVYNQKTRVNDLRLYYITMEDWFKEDRTFHYWKIDGPAKNPAIMAENGILNVVYESKGDLKCLYSSDKAKTIKYSTVAESKDNELYPDITGNGLEAVCAFNKNNNLYIAETTDGGKTWKVDETPINDVTGSVANEYHCINLLPYGVFWTDTRTDAKGVYSDFLIPPPESPTISGASSGKINTKYDFKVKTTHPDGLDVWYLIDWGDGTNTGWLGPYSSGTEITESHTWVTKQEFTIKARAKDEKGMYSSWSELPFSTPKTIPKYKSLFYNFLERFPLLQKIFGF